MTTLQFFVRRSAIIVAFAVLGCGPFAAAVSAQEAGAPPAAGGAMPDIVRLKNGGIVRGTISELVPDDKVVIIMLTGESRTFPMADVAYAGAVSAEPTAASALPTPEPTQAPAPAVVATRSGDDTRPFVTVHSGEARLHLLGAKDGTTFHVRTGTATASAWGGGASYAVHADAYTEICTAPCDASLPDGTHVLALSREGSAPVAADPIRVEGPTTLYGTYSDRSGVRIGGWIIFLGGAVAGTALMVSSIDGEAGLGTGFYAGAAIFGITTVVGLVMTMTGDGAKIERRAQP